MADHIVEFHKCSELFAEFIAWLMTGVDDGVSHVVEIMYGPEGQCGGVTKGLIEHPETGPVLLIEVIKGHDPTYVPVYDIENITVLL